MSYNDGVSDLVIRIKNAYLAALPCTIVRNSNMNIGILSVLKKNGYIADFSLIGDFHIKVILKYVNEGSFTVGAVSDIGRISKPGKRVYSSFKSLKKIYNGFGISILSTSQGIISDIYAREIKIGGEVLFYIF